ncbi:MAG: SDR family oxidoreductase [Holophagales bacterium]|nr:SDR family oxidoreductase [Holophagales bacterium]MYJ24036.1 SDR family oxidoreductase [Holophagales bacterium]
MTDFEEKTCLVTGGASGIGRATCEALAARGAHVVVTDVDEAAGRGVADAVGGEFAHLDVSDRDAWTHVVSGVVEVHGGLDLVHLNAGVTTYPAAGGGFPAFDIAAMPTDAYRRVTGANIDGVVFGVGATVRALENRGGGAIVVTASVAGLATWEVDPVYTMTKHAVVGLVRGLAPLLAERGVTLNAICPAAVATKIFGPEAEEFVREADLRLMPPAQVADAVIEAVTGGETGQCWVCYDGRDPILYVPAPLPRLA